MFFILNLIVLLQLDLLIFIHSKNRFLKEGRGRIDIVGVNLKGRLKFSSFVVLLLLRVGRNIIRVKEMCP